MAGSLRGTLQGNGASIGTSNALTGSVAVQVGDLVFVAFGQQTNLTATGATDNLGNTYTAQNAGTDAGTVTGRAFWSIATVGGTLTQVTVAAASSTNDWCGFVAVIEGPFLANASQPDRNPANTTADITSPFTCPATTALSQAQEEIMCWIASDGNASWLATAPNLKAGQVANATNIKIIIGYQEVESTSSVSPAFTGTNPTVDALGTITFKIDTSFPAGERVTDLSLPEPFPIDLRTWTFFNVNLYGEVPVEEMPFVQTDWPVPEATVYPNSLRSWTVSPQLQEEVVPLKKTLRRPLYTIHRPIPFLPAEPIRNTALLSEALVEQAPFVQTDWPIPRGPQQFVRTWINEGLSTTGFMPAVEVLALPPVGVPQFIRTWLQEPPPTEAVVAQPSASTLTALPPAGPQQPVRTWTQEPQPVAAPEAVPVLVIDWGVPKRQPTFIVADLQRNTALLTPVVADTPRNQYLWDVPKRPDYPVSLRTWTPQSIEFEFISRNALTAPIFERPMWRQADLGRNVALLETEFVPPIASVMALPPSGPVQPVRTWIEVPQITAAALPLNQEDWPVPRGPLYPVTLRFWGPNNTILRPAEQMPPEFLAHTVPRGHYYPDSLRSTIGVPGPGKFVPPVAPAFPHNIPFIATMGAMTAR